jgi:alpha-amylase
MNIIGDFITRVNNLYPDMDNEELSPLMTTIKNQEEELARKDSEIEKLRKTLEHLSNKNINRKNRKSKPKTSTTK